MRTNLITQLKEEWNNLDPVDPLRGLIADAIDALAEAQPSKPLPAHEIVTIYDESPTSDSDMIAFARAIERAHGIMSVPYGKRDA